MKLSTGTPRILVVDDEEDLTDLLATVLRAEGWQTDRALDGTAAVRAARGFRPDAVVLDRGLPDLEGLEVLRRLRAYRPDLPVLFLTARESVEDRVAGLRAGADDYVPKPFDLDEVVLRLRALLRRCDAGRPGASLLVVGDLTLDEETRQVHRAGLPVRLTGREFELLRYLMRHTGRVLGREELLDNVWATDEDRHLSIVESYVSYLRRKIERDRSVLIHTVRGVGYLMKPAEALR
ncbi:response regulator transcription factor [Streptomyces sp. NPDC048282]|uniref:response regulator transcription factor n=1 Tax=Streptomyces sp. NPDC048282 TaxID=3365528 RepID=UPI003716784F